METNCSDLLRSVLKVNHGRGEASNGVVVVVGHLGLWTGLQMGPAKPWEDAHHRAHNQRSRTPHPRPWRSHQNQRPAYQLVCTINYVHERERQRDWPRQPRRAGVWRTAVDAKRTTVSAGAGATRCLAWHLSPGAQPTANHALSPLTLQSVWCLVPACLPACLRSSKNIPAHLPSPSRTRSRHRFTKHADSISFDLILRRKSQSIFSQATTTIELSQ